MPKNRRSPAAVCAIGFLAMAVSCTESPSLPVGPDQPPPTQPELTGSIQVVASTTGEVGGLDTLIYTLTIDGSARGTLGINKSVTLTELTTGKHVVRLDGLAPTCSFVGASEITVNVPGGGQAIASFAISCSPISAIPTLPDLAYVVGIDTAANIYVGYSDGRGSVRLTSQPGWDGDPAWSPDGKQIAFTSKRDGHEEIYVMNADGTNQVRITNTNGEARQPAWSPDGTRIAFTAYVYGNGSWEKIYVMNADGTGVTSLSNGGIGNETAPDWSPDGSRIAFAGQFPGGADDRLLGIATMKPDGTDRRRLTVNYRDDIAPSWSPDGTRIAFAQTLYYQTEIYIVNANGTGKVGLPNAFDATDPTWSPDGKKIAYGAFSASNGYCWTSGPNYSCNLFIRIVGIDGSSPALLPATGPAYDPTWRR